MINFGVSIVNNVMINNHRICLSLLVKFALIMFMSLVTTAGETRCCWIVAGPQLLDNSDKYYGIVKNVDKDHTKLGINVNGKSVDFLFDSKNGSDEQRKLIETLKDGDTVQLMYMKENRAFHIEIKK